MPVRESSLYCHLCHISGGVPDNRRKTGAFLLRMSRISLFIRIPVIFIIRKTGNNRLTTGEGIGVFLIRLLDGEVWIWYSFLTSWAGRMARVHPAAGMFPAISCRWEIEHEDIEHLCG